MSVLAETAEGVKNGISSPKEVVKVVETKSNTEVAASPPYSWMVKPCNIYKEEFKDCKSIRDRFNQYFVDGIMRDCRQWGIDYENCKLWEDNQDISALNKVIESEKQRSRIRLKAHFDNDVWEHRDKPPEDWDKELPESILEEYKGSFLQYKAEEIKAENIDLVALTKDTDDIGRSWSCSIM